MLILAGLLARVRDRSGFTLIETIVAMVTGIIVTGALFAILEISVRQSSRLSGVAQATQVSRTAMTHIVDELRSACLSTNFTPVISTGSEATSAGTRKLVFVNGYDEKTSKGEEPPAELPASGIHKDVIEYNEAKQQLIDKTYIATSNTPTETAEKYSFGGSPASTVILAEKVKPIEEKAPVFEYYAYGTELHTGATEAASTLETKPLTASPFLPESEAPKAASVVVRFLTAPQTKETRLNATPEKNTFAEQTSQTIFTLGAPNSESTISAAPCE
jgi:type II secretory pathway pseudopilin PulG